VLRTHALWLKHPEAGLNVLEGICGAFATLPYWAQLVSDRILAGDYSISD